MFSILGENPGDHRVVYGLTAPLCAHLAAELSRRGPVVVVVSGEAEARRMMADAELFLESADPDDPAAPPPALYVPAPDSSPYAELSADRGRAMERMAALYRLASGGAMCSDLIVVSAVSLLRRVIAKDELAERARVIDAGAEIDRDELAALLVSAGYDRVPVVDDHGTFAVRGGVIDLFPPLYAYPVRIELFGDEIESMRLFDPSTQRTLRPIERLHVHPVRQSIVTGGADLRANLLAAADQAAHPSKATRQLIGALERGDQVTGIDVYTPAFHRAMAPLWSYLPAGSDATWLIVDPDAIAGAARDELESAEQRYRDRLDDHRIAFPPEQHYSSAAELGEALATPARAIESRSLELHDPGAPTDSLRVVVDDNSALRAELERARRKHADELLRPLVRAIATWREDDYKIAITCASANRTEKLLALLREYGVDPIRGGDRLEVDRLEPGAPPTIVRGTLSAGFCLPRPRLAVVTEEDIFGERRRRTSRRSRAAAKRARAALLGGVSDFSALEPGDYLVHNTHGVGLYRGLAKLPVGGVGRGRQAQGPRASIDFLHLEYVGGTLYLPVYRLDEVQRYVGAEGHKPRLDKLGGATWSKARRKVSHQVKALAEELLQLYAQRAALPGRKFPPGDAMFAEFEATFPFEETPDQQRAIDEVLADMEGDRPMDRLVCGDVGYGKTEVALRAALKAVLGGAQVALLAPTTVLVEQHHQTMCERFAGWPLTVAKLSRFQSRAEQLATIRGLAAGAIDVVVGTHRLLSKDVRFKDLGLLVVDEEQRFGVTHKERLKKARTQIDSLTLTATPIPRTLHLAMAGLRDLSIIATPPADRRSIRTFVSRVDDGVIRDGIRRELSRGGQVFLVAPRIGGDGQRRSLADWAEDLARIVPEAKVAVAHGQMSTEALERVMVEFIAGKFDVLVSTTIIENGLDIPRANTMFVDHAESFGLSQLYQLRGRIGRSSRRAFCYLLVPPPERLTKDARKRLEALQRFTDLGAGFQIASHDLEIRGAGDLLGRKQSGAIASIGFDAYTRMLEEAVAELRGEPITHHRDPDLSIDVPAYIPDDYIPDTGQRLDFYKRLAGAGAAEVDDLLAELTDRYGALPEEVALLGDVSVVKAHARQLRAQSLELTATRVTIGLGEETPLAPDVITAMVAQEPERYRLTPDMRLSIRFSEAERVEPTASARRRLLDLLACAT